MNDSVYMTPEEEEVWKQLEKKMTDVTAVLTERGNRYGKFTGHAEVTQMLKTVVATALAKRNKTLAPDQQEALDMICHKMGRIINGDPDYVDNFRDIAGYAQLVADRMMETDGTTDNKTRYVRRVNGEWVDA